MSNRKSTHPTFNRTLIEDLFLLQRVLFQHLQTLKTRDHLLTNK